MSALDPRLVSLTVVATVALYLAVLRSPHRRARSDDMLAALATVELEVVEPGAHRTARLSLPILIGRAPQATLVLSDGQVSRLHARIEMRDDGVYVEDLGSRNGTFVDGAPVVSGRRLANGDEITLGTASIIFRGVGSWK